MTKNTKGKKDRGNKLIAVRLEPELIRFVERLKEEYKTKYGLTLSTAAVVRAIVQQCAQRASGS